MNVLKKSKKDYFDSYKPAEGEETIEVYCNEKIAIQSYRNEKLVH